MVTLNIQMDLNSFSKSLWAIFSKWRYMNPSCHKVSDTL